MPDATQRAGAQIYGMAQIQARLLSYVDVIWIMVGLTAILIPLPFLMRRPKEGCTGADGALRDELILLALVLAYQFCQ